MTRRARPPEGYMDQSAPRATKWTPVVNPEPVYDGAAEKARFEEATRTTARLPGEDVCDWLARVGRAAGATAADRELPPGDRGREPGEDDA